MRGQRLSSAGHEAPRPARSGGRDAPASAPKLLRALQQTAGNAAVSRWLAAPAPRIGSAERVAIQRLPMKVVGVGGKVVEIETDDKSLAELAGFVLMPKNAGNAVLIAEFERRAKACTLDDVIALLRARSLRRLLDKGSPLRDASSLAARLNDLIAKVRKECRTAEQVVALIGALGTLELVAAEPALANEFKDIQNTAKSAMAAEQRERSAKQAAQKEAQEKAERERRTRVHGRYIELFRNGVVGFMATFREAGFPIEPVREEMTLLLALVDRLERLEKNPAAAELSELLKIANAISGAIRRIIPRCQATLGPLEPSAFAEELHGDYEYEVEQRRRMVEKILQAHMPQIIGLLNRGGVKIVRLRYRGSLTDALKNATKSTTLGELSLVRVLNLNEFDVDAFLEIEDTVWQHWAELKLLPALTTGGKIGLRELHGYLGWYLKNPAPSPDQEQRWKEALDLRIRIGRVLEIEDALQRELAEVPGYKLVQAPKRQQVEGEQGGGSKTEEEAEEPEMVGEFGFVLQPAQTTEAQGRTGKPYRFGQLRGLGLRLLELQANFTIDARGEELTVRLEEPQRTIEPIPRPAGRARAYTV